MSDIDWVVVSSIDAPALPNDWPSARHAYHWYSESGFVAAIRRGNEFAVWQLAYSRALHIDPSLQRELRLMRIPGYSVAVESKRGLIEKRRRVIGILLRCGDVDRARYRLVGLIEQELRLALLNAGIVPGCRGELENQSRYVLPGSVGFKTSLRLLGMLHRNRSLRVVAKVAKAVGVVY